MIVGFNGSCLSGGIVGGWGRYTSCLIAALKKNFSSDMFRIYENSGLNHTLWEQVSLPQQLKSDGVDVFHGPANGGLPLFSPCPTVLTIHDLFGEEASPFSGGLKMAKVYLRYWADWKIATKRADLIITVSEHVKQNLVKYGLEAQKIHVVYESAAAAFYPRADEFNHPRPYFLYVGSFDERKRVAELLEVFSGSKLECDIILVGRISDAGSVLKQKFAFDPRIKFAGQIGDDELARLYTSAVSFVTFSSAEGFGLPLVEAMTCACPVMAKNTSVFPEIIGDGGVLVSPETFVTEAEKLLNHPLQRKVLSLKALARSAMFSWDNAAKQTMMVYRRLA